MWLLVGGGGGGGGACGNRWGHAAGVAIMGIRSEEEVTTALNEQYVNIETSIYSSLAITPPPTALLFYYSLGYGFMSGVPN